MGSPAKATLDPNVITIKAAAAELGISDKSVYRLIRRGQLTTVKVPGLRRTLITRRSLATLME